MEINARNYPQIAFLILGLSNTGKKINEWNLIWPKFYRAHYNQQQALDLLSAAVQACNELADYQGVWGRLKDNLLLIGGPERTLNDETFDPANLLVAIPHENYGLKFIEQGNALRQTWGLCAPYVFGQVEFNEVYYSVIEPCQDPTLADVLDNPGIYEDELSHIIGYIRDVVHHEESSFLTTTPDKITLRPIPQDYKLVRGPEGKCYLINYVPVFHYYLNSERVTPEDLGSLLGQYQDVFDPDNTEDYSVDEEDKVFQPASDLDIVNQSRLFVKANKAHGVDDIWYRLAYDLDLGWNLDDKDTKAKLKEWQWYQYKRYQSLKSIKNDYSRDMAELLLAGYEAGVKKGYFEKSKASTSRKRT
jgi:hypothetical protein